MPRIPRMVHREISRDPIKPGIEFRACLIAFARTIHTQKHLLRELFGRRRITAHPVHETHDLPPIFLYQKRER